MKKEEITPGMVVQNIVTEKIGVPYEGPDYGTIEPSIEVAIVYQGDDKRPDSPHFLGTEFGSLEPYQLKPEDRLTNEYIDKICRPGEGAATCRYLTVGAAGYGCERVAGDLSVAWAMDDRVRENKSVAKSIN